MALWLQRQQQDRDRLVAGEVWQEHGLVFASRVGTPLSANNVIRAFRIITKKAGLGENWVPREMRHTFVSVLSANGVSVEGIALLVGHDPSATTETVYRHEIRPALTEGAEVMDKIFGLAPGLCLSRVERYVGPGDPMAGCVHRGRVCGVGPMRPGRRSAAMPSRTPPCVFAQVAGEFGNALTRRRSRAYCWGCCRGRSGRTGGRWRSSPSHYRRRAAGLAACSSPSR
jgi:hypothetical protein